MKIIHIEDDRHFFCFDESDNTFVKIDIQHFLSFPQDENDEVGKAWNPQNNEEISKVYRNSVVVDSLLRVIFSSPQSLC
jgi:hypothetical protein